MDNARAMCSGERISNLDRNRQRLLERRRALRQAIRQRLPVEVLQDEVVRALVATDIMQRADMRMVQCGNGARLTFEAFAQRRIITDMGGQYLDRHGAIEAGVLRFIDLL